MPLQPVECSLIGLCEKNCHLALFLLRAIEADSALDEGAIAVRNRQEPERRNIVPDGQSAFDHPVRPAMAHVGRRQQLLTHAPAALHSKVPDTANLVAAQAGFDVAVSHGGKPIWARIKKTNKNPHPLRPRRRHPPHKKHYHSTPPPSS